MADKHVTVEQPGEDFNLATELSLDLHSLIFFKFLPYFRFLIFKQTRVNELPLGKSEAQHNDKPCAKKVMPKHKLTQTSNLTKSKA